VKDVPAGIFPRVEVKPALNPSLRGGPRIPGDTQGLKPPVREGDQVLLQGIHAKRVLME
jgi:hypothetical protein